MKTTSYSAPDIECQGCANAIKKALSSIEGVSRIDVNIETKTVQVTYAPQVAEETLVAALDRAGFPGSAAS